MTNPPLIRYIVKGTEFGVAILPLAFTAPNKRALRQRVRLLHPNLTITSIERAAAQPHQLNPCAKSRTKDNPYEIWTGNGWTWRVLKKWQADDDKPYARWFCFVTSPLCPDGEYGDVYVAKIKAAAIRTDAH